MESRPIRREGSSKAAREGRSPGGYLFSHAQYRAPSASKIIAPRNTKTNATAISSKFLCNVAPRDPLTAFDASRSIPVYAMSTVLAALAMLAVSIEMPVTAAVFGALAFYAVGHIA
jgi:hypothetical protein